MASKLEASISEIEKKLQDMEKRQDVVLQLSREVIRDCAKAIKSIHLNDMPQCELLLKQIDAKVSELKKADEDFGHISANCYQEVVEVKVLYALMKKKEIPALKELNVDYIAYLTGLADATGELRRALQLSLRAGKKEDAEFYFQKMNEIYDNLMTLKYSSSLVGPLKRKQDVLRGQIEQARSEMLK